MKKNIAVIAACAALSIPIASHATPIRPGPYVSGFIGVSALRDTDVTSTRFAPPAQTFNDNVEFDPSINIGGTGGYDFGMVRLEGELSYKYGEISAINDQTNNVRYVNTNGNLGALAMLANVFIDLHNYSPITPYFGGGVGFAALHLDDTFGTNSSTGASSQLYFHDDQAVFAYQVGGGFEIALNRRFSLDLGYRYFATSTAKFENNPFQSTELKFESHNGSVGFRVKF